MQAVVLTVHLLLALALILVVLLQRSEGGGLGMGGGGIMTSRGAATALSKVTWAIGIAFVVTSLALTIIAARGTRSSSVVDTIGTETSAAGDDASDDAGHAGARARGRPLAQGPGRRGSGSAAPGEVGVRRSLGNFWLPAFVTATGCCAEVLAAAVDLPYRLSPVRPLAFAESKLTRAREQQPMARFIFITGGVVSSLGKGLASAALGRAVAGARLFGAAAQARSLPQRRSRDDVAVRARRGLRHRRRGGDRPRPRALRALHRGGGAAQRFDLVGADLFQRAGEGAPRRLPRQDHPGHPARHQRDQGLPAASARTRSTSCSARSAARSATSRGCRSSRRSASSARTSRGATASTCT